MKRGQVEGNDQRERIKRATHERERKSPKGENMGHEKASSLTTHLTITD